ncbi:hypothetical protein [Aminobacter carboxidus]|uniref:Uncharacterized protein n=1 Tax=Aminobacter carboxidus TaxID=376165 RepID=A0ABR9GQK5_9HYPH|nr:hypothetical protein [Aminobacter carboxidus]MBE1205966.1 hypothetical protein [Aminobacter carboxidus]
MERIGVWVALWFIVLPLARNPSIRTESRIDLVSFDGTSSESLNRLSPFTAPVKQLIDVDPQQRQAMVTACPPRSMAGCRGIPSSPGKTGR